MKQLSPSVNIQILPHTADLRMVIQAGSLEDLFLASLHAMNQVLYKGHLKKPTLPLSFSVEASDATSLLIEFLSEVLTLTHIHKAIFYEVETFYLGDKGLSISLIGSPVSEFLEDIKAVTYHEADIRHEQNKFKTTLVFDI